MGKNKQLSLLKWMADLGVLESEIQESFIIGSGNGGQNRQKTASAVQLSYQDFQTTVQSYRQRELNRYEARKRLCEWKSLQLGIKTKTQIQLDKKRKQKKRRKRRQTQDHADDVG